MAMLRELAKKQLGSLGFLWLLGPLGLVVGQSAFFGFFFFELFGVLALLAWREKRICFTGERWCPGGAWEIPPSPLTKGGISVWEQLFGVNQRSSAARDYSGTQRTLEISLNSRQSLVQESPLSSLRYMYP